MRSGDLTAVPVIVIVLRHSHSFTFFILIFLNYKLAFSHGGQTDEWMDRQTDGGTHRQKDGRTDPGTEIGDRRS